MSIRADFAVCVFIVCVYPLFHEDQSHVSILLLFLCIFISCMLYPCPCVSPHPPYRADSEMCDIDEMCDVIDAVMPSIASLVGGNSPSGDVSSVSVSSGSSTGPPAKKVAL